MAKFNYDPLPTSDNLTALLSDMDKLKVRSKQSKDEVGRLTRLLGPQFYNVTVTRVADIVKDKKEKSGVTYTGLEMDESARKQDALQRTLAGESLADATGVKEQLEKEHRQWSAIEDAIEHLTREIAQERSKLAREYCKRLKPIEKELMGRVGKQMLELHAAYSELYSLQRHLIDNSIGCHGICLDLPLFLSTPTNKYSDLASWLHTAKREGYIKEVPSELRI